MKKLNVKELEYWKMMEPKSGVLYVEGRPGEGKSAIFRAIAEKLGMQYFDLRLAQMDEVDVGLYPVYDKETKSLSHAVPEWAVLANQKPTIIVFEELNRARKSVCDAALQILLERAIGFSFKFNDGVYMCATGNLGEEDGTNVEQFDAALWNRLLPIKHSLSIKEWREGFADKNIYEPIVSFLEKNPSHAYQAPTEKTKQYATYRSWTFLSDRIKFEFLSSREDRTEDIINFCKKKGNSYVGNSIIPFIRYLEDQNLLNIKNVIDDFSKYSEQINSMGRAKKSSLVQDLKSVKISSIKSEDKLKNIINFLNIVDSDERLAYIIHLIDTEISDSPKEVCNSSVEKLIKSFPHEVEIIKKTVDC